MEDFVVGLLDHREVFDLVEPVEHPLRPQLLPPDRNFAALVVPEDHERPCRAVPEALLEQLRVANRAPQQVLEIPARDELRQAVAPDPPRPRDPEAVVPPAPAA